LVGVGADLAPGTLLAAYRQGLFPMPLQGRLRGRLPGARAQIGWWSPDPRGVLPLDRLRVSRSLRRSCRRFAVTVDVAFSDVVAACADPRRPAGWITGDISAAYRRLHDLGWAHSVEAWTPDGRLAGGLYGVAIGGLFAGESMFAWRPDASKVALVALVRLLATPEVTGRLLDVQWATPHLCSLGAVELPRAAYLDALPAALAAPVPAAFAGPPTAAGRP
jgi:leucyl/phenylalanyl-tRNA--protein transferase